MKTGTKLSAILFTSLMGCMVSNFAAANVTFSDNTFNLSDYSVSKYQKGDTTASITVSQISAGGNPGSALQIETHIPIARGQSISTVEYLINPTFRYDPSIQGAITSIDASIDLSGQVFVDGSPSRYSPVGGSNGGGLVLVRQAGNIYTNLIGVAGPPVVGTGDYSTAHATDLKATDFGRVTDLAMFTVDKTQNPSFSSGIIELGVPGYLSYRNPFGFVIPEISATARYDNLNFTVTSVPEPETYAMFVAGLGLIGWLRRRKNKLWEPAKLH